LQWTDILFIFSVHVTLPASYEKVCEKLFGKLKKPSDLGRRDEKLNPRTNRRWKKEYGENMHQSPYWDETHFEWHPESAPTNWQVSLIIIFYFVIVLFLFNF
jgi:AICAR transformylase/IMP cyclohydrolase PurH